MYELSHPWRIAFESFAVLRGFGFHLAHMGHKVRFKFHPKKIKYRSCLDSSTLKGGNGSCAAIDDSSPHSLQQIPMVCVFILQP